MARMQRGKVIPHITWMIRAHMPAVTAISRDVSRAPWNEKDFATVLRDRNSTGYVAEWNGHAVGYIVAVVAPTRVLILDLAVDLDTQRMGVGTDLVKRAFTLASKCRKRKSVVACVRESDLTSQLFFKSLNFKCSNIVNDAFGNEAGYRMVAHVERS